MSDNNAGPEQTPTPTAPWVCLRARDYDYDGHFYSLTGNREGYRKLGEMLIELSNSDTTEITLPQNRDSSTIKDYHLVLERLLVLETSFENFQTVDKEDKKNEPQNGIGSIVFLAVVILFIIGVINGLWVLLKDVL